MHTFSSKNNTRPIHWRHVREASFIRAKWTRGNIKLARRCTSLVVEVAWKATLGYQTNSLLSRAGRVKRPSPESTPSETLGFAYIDKIQFPQLEGCRNMLLLHAFNLYFFVITKAFKFSAFLSMIDSKQTVKEYGNWYEWATVVRSHGPSPSKVRKVVKTFFRVFEFFTRLDHIFMDLRFLFLCPAVS